MNNSIFTKSDIVTFLQNEPLIILDDDTRAADFSGNAKRHNALFMGIGVATDQVVSSGLPFDILGMLLVAEKLRRKFAFETILIQIADEHAASNKLVADDVIHAVAARTKKELIDVCRKLGLEHVEIVLSSEIDKTSVLKELEAKPDFASIAHNRYLVLELADMEFFRRHRNVTTKLSWIIPGVASNGHDERFFDSLFLPMWGKELNFIHVEPGFTFDSKTWRTSPYIHNAAHNRVVIAPGENVWTKFELAEKLLNDKELHGARNHLKRIVRLLEALFGTLGSLPLEDKIQLIIDRITDETR